MADETATLDDVVAKQELILTALGTLATKLDTLATKVGEVKTATGGVKDAILHRHW